MARERRAPIERDLNDPQMIHNIIHGETPGHENPVHREARVSMFEHAMARLQVTAIGDCVRTADELV